MPAPVPSKKASSANSGAHPDDPKSLNFVLNSDDSQFTNRTSSVFGTLSQLEDKHVQHVRHSDFNEERSMWKSDPDSEDVRGGKSDSPGNSPFGTSGGPPFRGQDKLGDNKNAFKRPHPAPGKRGGRHGRGRGNVPGFRTEPNKWRRYDLSSVTSGDMSDKSNAKAAFEFLNELKDRKETEPMDVEVNEDSRNIVFKRPEKKDIPAAAGSSSEAAGSSSKSSLPMPPAQGKVIMPEYVVGEKVKKPKSKPSWAAASATVASTEAVQLDHIKDAEADTKELPKDTQDAAEGAVFKSSKGKGKRHVRKRHTEDEDD